MPAISFQEKFAWLVADEKKCQTIRQIRKRNPIKVGQKNMSYWFKEKYGFPFKGVLIKW